MARQIEQWSREPYYRQLAGFLRDDIRSGAIAPGEKLPSEPELQRTYGLSRGVVRQALALLRDEGLVETVGRIGSRVQAPQGLAGMRKPRRQLAGVTSGRRGFAARSGPAGRSLLSRSACPDSRRGHGE